MKLTAEEKAVKRYISGESVNAIIAEIGRSRSTIYFWIRKDRENRQTDDEEISAKNFKALKRKLARQEEIIQILREINCKFTDSLKTKLYAMEEIYSQHSVHILCDTMMVARGTFYNHMLRNKKFNTSYAVRKEELRVKIQEIYDESNQIFGAAKIRAVLKNKGINTSEEMIRTIMRDMGITSIRQDSKRLYDKEQQNCRNKLKQQFITTAPNQVWVGDITYFRYKEKNYYICAIIDLFARKVVAHKIGSTNSTQLAKSTFRNAYAKRKPNDGLIFQSDNGNCYRSYTFCNYLKSLSVSQSFSRPYVPYDNSVMESFFSSMKREELYRRKYRSKNELLKSIDDYMAFYNDTRPHYKNSYKTPTQKEDEYCERN